MNDDITPDPAPIRTLTRRRLTAAEFQGLSDVPPEAEWFANIRNRNTRRAYRADLKDFMEFVGIHRPEEFRLVTRSHVIAWRRQLESQDLAPATVRRRLSALASLFAYLCEANAVESNPVRGIARPNDGANQGKTPAISDSQALRLLEAPKEDTLKGIRDRAILSVLLYHGLRREELCKLRVKDVQERTGVVYFVVRGKGDKLRYVPAELGTLRRIQAYLDEAGHALDREGPLFRRVRGCRALPPRHPDELSPGAVARSIVQRYAAQAEISLDVLSPHSLRATAATNAIEGGSDLEEVRMWLGHANVSTTVMYDRRRHRPEDSPTFKVNYKRRST